MYWANHCLLIDYVDLEGMRLIAGGDHVVLRLNETAAAIGAALRAATPGRRHLPDPCCFFPLWPLHAIAIKSHRRLWWGPSSHYVFLS